MSALRSPFLHSPIKLPPSVSSSLKAPCIRRLQASCPRIRAIDLDQNTVVAITVGVVSVAVGIGIPVFTRLKSIMPPREKALSCASLAMAPEHLPSLVRTDAGFMGEATIVALDTTGGTSSCNVHFRFCLGTGSVTMELGGDEREVSRCINCDGAGLLTCTTCQGSGIQPRYLDRREFKDDDRGWTMILDNIQRLG